MRFYKKIFIAFFGLLIWSVQTASGYPPLSEGDDVQLCAEGAYIAKCDFVFDTGQYPAVDLTPEMIFAFIAAKTGYLCWDFDEPQNNYNNLHILFGDDTAADLECYADLMGTPIDKLNAIRSNNKPNVSKQKIGHTQYEGVAELLRDACKAQSIPEDFDATPPKQSYCAICPSKNSNAANSKGAFVKVTGTDENQTIEWKQFSTIADCFYWDHGADYTHEDNTGTFKYINDPNNGACYYSGE